jgi:UDP-N-acetylmuramyl pentapeptide phosphotransferase/UDP-N-acetylglucosamine-1-phosphate transferase/tetratricopeptide (TPR) repeat protein
LPLEARLIVGLALAMAVAYAVTPVAIRLAARFDFYDAPIGYKDHAAPTPYLGGLAVITGFAVALLALTSDAGQTLPVLGGVVVLWAVGTLDDRRTVGPLPRVAVESALGAMLWVAGLGWSLGLGGAVDLLATVFWVVAVVNAFNLFDNMDGASSTMACVVAAAVAVLGLVQSDVWLVATGAALCGACLGFLPHNLSRPAARIFLGDGGSMPVGFAIAALVMIGASSIAAEWQALVMGLLLVGVPALDTCLVVVSRRRRGVSILTGGHDHLTHRTRARLRTAHASVAALGAGQALLAALALVAVRGGPELLVPVVVAYLVAMATLIAVLDAAPLVAAAGGGTSAVLDAPRGAGAVAGVMTGVRPDAGIDLGEPPAAPAGLPATSWPALAVLAALGIALGLSPFAGGFYHSSIWAPAGLGLLVVLTAALIAGPVDLPRRAVVAPAAIAALALLSLASALWTDSIEQAVVDGNRLLIYAAGLALLVVLLRSDRGAVLSFAAFAAGAVAVAGWVLAGMLRGDEALFLGGRLNEPLGYINGQASFFVLAFWPCLALAERRRGAHLAPLAGLGVAGTTLFAGLAVLGQSRGAVLAAALSLLLVFALLPGRLRRIVALLVSAMCLAPAMPALLDVYRDGAPAGRLRDAAVALLLATVAAGAIWALLVAFERRASAGRLRARRAVGAGVAVLALAGAVAGVASADRIGSFLDHQYTVFVTLGGPQGEPTASRLANGAGNRYDYWRIAIDAWQAHPLAGVGAGGYDKPYFAQRATSEDIRQPHSLPLQVLAELGIGGALLFAAALVLIAAGAWRRIRDGGRAPVVVAGLGVVTAWFGHTSVDWMHLLPGLTGVALLGAAVLLRPAGGDGADAGAARASATDGDGADAGAAQAAAAAAAAAAGSGARSGRARVASAVLIGVAITVAALSLSRQGLSERYVERAQAALAGDPARALVEANRALRLDRESIAAYYTKAAALARFGEGEAARAVLLDATRREPRNFVTWALLGDLSVRQGDLRAAQVDYRRAARLNPRDPGLAKLARDPRAGAHRLGGG